MKNIVIITAFCLSCCNVIIAQTDYQRDSIMYMVTYNYIINDSINIDKAIAVSDSIVDLDRFWFSNDVECPVEKERLKQYRAKKQYVWFNPFYSSCLNSLFCKNPLSNNILFFSQIENNMLRADILPYRDKYVSQCDKFNYDKIAFQNIGYIYLFIFTPKGAIKSVLQKEMIYE
jgi:hypothetical protein